MKTVSTFITAPPRTFPMHTVRRSTAKRLDQGPVPAALPCSGESRLSLPTCSKILCGKTSGIGGPAQSARLLVDAHYIATREDIGFIRHVLPQTKEPWSRGNAIDHRRHAHRSEETYRMFVSHSSEGIFRADMDARFRSAFPKKNSFTASCMTLT